MSLFAAALRITGLSQQEASNFLTEQTDRNVSLDTVKSMANGRSRVHAEIWTALRGLYIKQVTACEAALDIISEKQPESVELFEDGPRSASWPSLRVHHNTLAMIALEGDFEISA